ncbi:DUF4392 domain-containing protein [Leadbettera azotonutricia]|uniref:D-glutamate cyclase-like C-terminal domain-containing protein n=1 Tax=Leadbettera azotonutricia (strain ATCC BAA-888 / DSM 13862 / ZAS-9) TaxID=545695 RepID=F5YAA6_LEAAZ|nr:DUF4392 domain-containing protein [Leadbettera azotonutricia]AEF83023.1 conserved hypothetical protein [Leadbettera azotonutricia ZAS-9]
MTQKELTEFNLGKSLDSLMNLDPRGYGVCNILYEAAYKRSGGPLTMKAAEVLLSSVGEGDTVFIITGFVLKNYNKAETDGPVGAAALARSLIIAKGAKPVFIVPGEAADAVKRLSAIMGFHLYGSFEELRARPLSAGIMEFTKSADGAKKASESLWNEANAANCVPKFCIAIEAPGANSRGVYHNAVGLDISPLEAKTDVLFSYLKKKNVPTLAIGDLGNECGMGALKAHLEKYIPYAAPGGCSCGCGGGIAAVTAADTVLTTTVSNWGAYGICSALAYLSRNKEVLYSPGLEERALRAASEAGLIDMYGWQIPQVDGMNLAKNTALITLMNECVLSAFELEETCRTWFAKTLELGYFDGKTKTPSPH